MQNSTSQSNIQPYLLLLTWIGLLLLSGCWHQSLMAHDEGNYALEARFMVESGDWLARLFWGNPVYTHGIALNWLIAVGYTLFGISDGVARLPSLIACLLSTFFLFEISRILLKDSLAMLASLILGVIFIWLEYARLATQDMLLVCLELTGLWALLQAERLPKGRIIWGFLAGSVIGLGFLVKSFMILLPVVALMPYLVLEHHRHRHLLNPGLYGGLIAGVLVDAIWLKLSLDRYGSLVTHQLFGKISELGAKPFHTDTGWHYYFWNIPINAFPWAFFALIGLWVALKDYRKSPHVWLLIGYPLLLFLLLNLFPTKTPYYILQLHPFTAMFAAIGLVFLSQRLTSRLAQTITYGFGILGIVLAIAGLVLLVKPPGIDWPREANQFGIVALILGAGWSLLPVIPRHVSLAISPQLWIGQLLISSWLALGAVGLLGLVGDYSPALKSVLQEPQIASVLKANPVDFLVQDLDPESHKTWILLSFYTPHLGKLKQQIVELQPSTYAWLSPKINLDGKILYRVIGNVQQWTLVQVEKIP
ncbi:hypothetical protein BST81_25090 [Leptolyngbya sp. 'hensonii']|uniref:ArnT family glycosyltransferase n=1 Tax=Leptolyngbya sp. 'hensonii' TaxID=1922337 RepID=UPI00094FDA02|nr:glycosyltransferase family 39 protein [Leptolyngbya sp. 'hensonii']OLP15632.1 hypothetical protein BST81_25090 [Leptolyngbya sp. 'hensonii']